jgi:hypothetical protein
MYFFSIGMHIVYGAVIPTPPRATGHKHGTVIILGREVK